MTLKAINISHSILADEKALQTVVGAIQVKIPEIEELCASKRFIGDIIKPIINDFQGSMHEIDEYSRLLRTSLDSANDAMDTIVAITQDVDTGVDTAQKWFIVCVWISAFFFIVVVAVMVCCILIAAYEKYNWFTTTINAIGWPLFSVLLFLVWLFTSLFLAASLSGSDVCIQPDEAVFSFLENGFRNNDTKGVEHAIYLNLVNYVMVRESCGCKEAGCCLMDYIPHFNFKGCSKGESATTIRAI